jgi:hypothetical protein
MGTDTHRAWEILLLRTVPIVLTSPLDLLYSQFPVVIVKNWSEPFLPNQVERYRDMITKKFGAEPFSEGVLNKLTMSYWIKLIRDSRPPP